MRIKGVNDDAEVLLGIGPKPKTFSYAELRSATKDFNIPNKLGEGGYGPMYKEKEICNLIGLPSSIYVWELQELLAYLHKDPRPKIVHRDVKVRNILLDAKLCPKISDFGLAKLNYDTKTHINTKVAGTIGYLAPEYTMRRHLTEKVEVFSFGVVALEIIIGRATCDTSLDSDKIYLLEWAWSLHESNQSLGLIDPQLTEFNEIEALRVVAVALLCTQASPALRPPMSSVLRILAGDIEVGLVISKPSYLTDWEFKGMTNCFLNKDIDTSSSTRSYSKKNSQSEIATDLSSGVDPLLIPVNVTRFSDIIADGR